MALTLFSTSRTVLIIADEALYIYTATARGVRLVEAVPWDAPNFESNVAGIIARDCGKKPLLVLNDMVEQHYRKERVVKAGVGLLDKSSMLRRKLNVAFPNYPVRAAFILKEKITRAENRLPADVYIFAAVPESSQFKASLQAARLSLASITAFCLLPVESSDMVKLLAEKLAGRCRIRSKWVVFIGQHRNGSLRQIVTKDGELALTRMTPIVESDDDSVLWAQEVHQEFKATMSYLSRFGYQQEDGLDVIVMANSDGGAALQGMIEEKCNFNSLTAPQAASLLGFAVGDQDDNRYADTLHAGWAARKSKFILPMKAISIDAVSRPRQVAMAASVLLFGGALFLAYQLANSTGTLMSIREDIEDAKSRIADLDAQYQVEVKKKEEVGFDVRLVQSSIAVRDQLEANNIHLLPLVQAIGKALGNNLNIDQLKVSLLKRELPKDLWQPSDPSQSKIPVYEASMTMTYPSTANVQAGNQEVRNLGERIKKFLPGYKVEIVKLLKDFEYVESIEVETGGDKKKQTAQDYTAEIKITGP